MGKTTGLTKLEGGHETMCWESKVHVIACVTPVSNHWVTGKRPESWRKANCCRAYVAIRHEIMKKQRRDIEQTSVAIDCRRSCANARFSRRGKNPYTPDSPHRVALWQKSKNSPTVYTSRWKVVQGSVEVPTSKLYLYSQGLAAFGPNIWEITSACPISCCAKNRIRWIASFVRP